MKPRYIFLIAIASHVLSCGEPLVELEAVPPVSLTTGEINLATLTATGEIEGVGDGIVQHGHVWSSATNMPTVNDSRTELGGKSEGGEFVSLLNSLEPNKTYSVRGYARDVHDLVSYGKPVQFSTDETANNVIADFVINNNNCVAPCLVEFENRSVNATQYSWDFGDGSPIDTSGSPSHLYAEAGVFNVTLTAKGSDGMMNSVTKPVTVRGITFGQTYPDYGDGRKVIVLDDGSYVILGRKITNAFPQKTDIYLARILEDGTLDPAFGDQFNFSDKDLPGGVVQLDNGKFVVAGSAIQPNGKYDIFCFIAGPDGKMEGTPRLYGEDEHSEKAHNLIKTPDNRILIVGESVDAGFESDVYLIKANSDLSSTTFRKRLPGGAQEKGFDVALGSGNTYFIAGTISSSLGAQTDVMVLKTDALGNILSGPFTFGGGDVEECNAIMPAPGGGFVVCGTTFSGTGNGDIFLVKIEESGNAIVPPLSFGGNERESGNDVMVLPDGAVIVAGEKDAMAYMVKFDKDLELLWENTEFQNTGNNYLQSIAKTSDGGFVATGGKATALYLVKTDSQGKTTQ
jgi:PKD repeat protein